MRPGKRGTDRLDIKPGDEFHFLRVLKEAGKIYRSIAWECECKCGKVVRIRASYLKSGVTKSCGCHKIGKNNKHYKGHEDISGTYWSSLIEAKEETFRSR